MVICRIRVEQLWYKRPKTKARLEAVRVVFRVGSLAASHSLLWPSKNNTLAPFSGTNE